MNYSDSILKMIRDKESFAGAQSDAWRKEYLHRNTMGTHGAYYDASGYLTTGYGSLISRAPKGSLQESKDIEKWKRKHGMNPFNLNAEQAEVILPRDIDMVLSRTRKQLGDVKIEDLQEPLQKAIISLSYQTGQIGNRTAAQLKRALETKSKEDYEQLANMFENWHGAKADSQLPVTLERRKTEAQWIRSIPTLNNRAPQSLPSTQVDDYDGDGMFDIEQDAPTETAVAPVEQDNLVMAREDEGLSLGLWDKVTAPSVSDTDLTTSFASIEDDPSEAPSESPFDPKAAPRITSVVEPDVSQAFTPELSARAIQDAQMQEELELEAKPWAEELTDFKDHLANSFVTENIVGSSIKNLMVNWDVDKEYDPNFDATELPDYAQMTQDLSNEELRDILGETNNGRQFYSKVEALKAEKQARNEMAAYMKNHPVAGFVGIGISSAADVTSLIPVTKLAQVTGIAKAGKTIPAMARAIGAGAAENLIQDLLQEAVLVNNSDVRKWDDGDILYGAVASGTLGALGGAFKYSKGLSDYRKLAEKYVTEKNLDQMEVVLAEAKAKNYDAKVIKNLTDARDFIAQEFDRVHTERVMNQVLIKQQEIGADILNNKKIEMINAQESFVNTVDAQIAAERTVLKEARLAEFKVKEKDITKAAFTAKTEINKLIVPLKKELQSLKKAPKSSSVDYRIKKINREIEKLETRLNKVLSESNYAVKKVKSEKTKFIRGAQKAEESLMNETIKTLEQSKKLNADRLKADYDMLTEQVNKNSHPLQAELLDTPNLNNMAEALGLPIKFSSLDDIDEFLGLKFKDSTHKSASSAATRFEPSEFLGNQDVNTLFNKTDPELWSLVSRIISETKSNPTLSISSHVHLDKTSVSAGILRATRLNEVLSTESVIGRFILNKNALRNSSNEFASAFYDWLAPDGAGRLSSGRFSVAERAAQIKNVIGGNFREKMFRNIEEINVLALDNAALRKDLGLPENRLAAKLWMTEVMHREKVADLLLRNELINSGFARATYGDEVGDAVEKWVRDFNLSNQDMLLAAKNAGVDGAEELISEKNWFHRSWDNDAARAFDIKHGTAKFEELIRDGMRKYALDNGVNLTADMEELIAEQANKFRFGLVNRDLQVIQASQASMEDFMQNLIRKDLDGLDKDVLRKELNRLVTQNENRRMRELGKRKPVSLKGSVTLEDGTLFTMDDLLEKNILKSQADYIDVMSGRVAAAENGIKDINLLREWADRAYELEMRRGNVENADFIRKAMEEDIDTLIYGSAGRSGDPDKAVSRFLRMANKYNFARLMQYTGISSIAEHSKLLTEAGYVAVGKSISNNLNKVIKSYFMGGITGKQFTNQMYKEIGGIMTGLGLEDLNYDTLISSSQMITKSSIGRGVERVIDNSAKLTRRATGHIETTGRRLAAISLAQNYADIAFGNSKVGSLLGGLSNRNLVELGYADLVNGKVVRNASWDELLESIRKFAKDEDGNFAYSSGKPIVSFNINMWNDSVKTKWAKAITTQANHIFTNPDSTTAKLWHNTLIGSVFNQFKSFSNNAASKVAGHNVNQVIQGMRMGEVAELSKYAQNIFWSAMLGKLSLVLYASINNAGREDFNDRVSTALAVDDVRDWTKALGRSSVITGFDSLVDTSVGMFGVDPFFDSSTIGQSRNRLDVKSTATGQLVTGLFDVGNYVMERKFDKAATKAIGLSPFRRQLGVNQLLNAMGVD